MKNENAPSLVLTENESAYLPVACVHRLENRSKISLELIEVQTGSYLGEDDIVRFEDQYGRPRWGKSSSEWFEGELEFDHSKPDGSPQKMLNSAVIIGFGRAPTTKISDGLDLAMKEFIERRSPR